VRRDRLDDDDDDDDDDEYGDYDDYDDGGVIRKRKINAQQARREKKGEEGNLI
jgi:hypothetical protein